MNGISLFAGIGGIDLGLQWAAERAGGGDRSVCYVEKDQYCQRVLRARIQDGTLHDAPIWDDVRTFDGRPWAGRVDIVAGGFPCQDLSLAGKRAGLDGERSGLFYELWRIVREVRPRYVFMENVPGLLTAGFGRGAREVASSGYDLRWESVSAAAVGAPHIRERLWMVAYSNCEWKPQQEGSKQNQRGRTCNGGSKAGQIYPDSDSERFAEYDTSVKSKKQGFDYRLYAEQRGKPWWSVEPNVGRVANGIPNRIHRVRALGNAVVPQCVDFVAGDLFAMFDVGEKKAA